jgi:hypothetical protein
VFYFGFAREEVKTLFLFLNVSSGNITMCREQHAAHEPHVNVTADGKYNYH